MPRLNIPDRRERWAVHAADAALAPFGWLRRRRRPDRPPRSILCFRLERIGDLLMTLPALAALRAAAPEAAIDLVVGSWNLEIARAIPGIRDIEVLDPEWLAREGSGMPMARLLAGAFAWRRRRYDLVINFEPDIRSNLLAAATGGRVLAGFSTGGGGPLLDVALPHDPRRHTADNAVSLVAAAVGAAPGGPAQPQLDPAARHSAGQRLAAAPRPLVGMHVSGGRPIKQWPEDRFAAVARWLIERRGATVVFTGTAADRAQIARVTAGLPPGGAIDVSGVGLAEAAALLGELDVFVTGDTGPMHLAHAVGTPVVAVFGPSDPVRYAPRGTRDRIVRIDLPCSPCNRIRLPPARCAGHTPDCLAGVPAAAVTAAIDDVLAGRRPDSGEMASIA
jgi:ADP-heptose:LPS heptosyltransferase